ncbi:nicotinamide N-methyltransferase-like [Dysidea avara]|uniref:nicotinamide N-methyltransferase-like n=1 Tax=Dysidea avara TaxID=196820 RepID=UPI003324D8BD
MLPVKVLRFTNVELRRVLQSQCHLHWKGYQRCTIGSASSRYFSSENLQYEKDYKEFDARAFLNLRCPGTEFNTVDKRIRTQWRLKSVHNFYKDYHKKWDISTAKVLEFGSGPYLHKLISAAPYVGEIYHSDFAPSCRNEVLMWMRKDPNAFNWDPYFKYVVNTLEGQDGGDAVVKRQELLRSKFKDSLFVDMFSDNMLPTYSGKFDIIYTGYCIEFVAPSLEDYEATIKRLFDQLNQNGFLVMITAIECTAYFVDSKTYPCYPLHINDALNALRKAGFTTWYAEINKMELEEGVAYPTNQNYYSCYVAQKI